MVQERPVGLLWVANSRAEFPLYLKDIMGALADYAAIAVVNARLFGVMYQRSQQLEAANKQLQALSGGEADPASMRQVGQQVAAKIRNPLTHLLGTMNLFRTGEMGQLATTQQAAVDVMHRTIAGIVHALDEIAPPDSHG